MTILKIHTFLFCKHYNRTYGTAGKFGGENILLVNLFFSAFGKNLVSVWQITDDSLHSLNFLPIKLFPLYNTSLHTYDDGWAVAYVTGPGKTDLIYTKYTCSYYGTYILFCVCYPKSVIFIEFLMDFCICNDIVDTIQITDKRYQNQVNFICRYDWFSHAQSHIVKTIWYPNISQLDKYMDENHENLRVKCASQGSHVNKYLIISETTDSK